MNDQWQDSLRKRMDLYEERAPEGLWKGIEGHIDTFGLVFKNSNRKKLVILSLSSVAVAAVAIIIFLLMPYNIETNVVTTDNAVVSEFKEATELVIDNTVTDVIVAENHFNSQAKQSVPLQQQQNNILVKVPSDEKVINQEVIIIEDEITNDKITNNEGLGAEEVTPTQNNQLLASSTINSNKKRSRWQTNLGMSNIPSSSSFESYSGFSTFSQKEVVEDQYKFLPLSTNNNAYTDIKSYTEIDHNLPISVALTFRYRINQRWGVSSGLTYSLLTSKLRSESLNYFNDDRQTLHYMGVPLIIDYKLWQNNSFSTYISAGGLVEKNIAGKLSSDYYLDNKFQISTSENISSKQLQWSINSAVGFEYRVTDLIGIYAEPGIVYYFKNNSNIETIYKDRPFNFNLRLGLRINFND